MIPRIGVTIGANTAPDRFNLFALHASFRMTGPVLSGKDAAES